MYNKYRSELDIRFTNHFHNLVMRVNAVLYSQDQEQGRGDTETDLASRLPLPALVLAQQNATVGAVVLRHSEPGHAEWDQGTGNASGSNYHFTVLLT